MNSLRKGAGRSEHRHRVRLVRMAKAMHVVPEAGWEGIKFSSPPSRSLAVGLLREAVDQSRTDFLQSA